jgi:hypothetical protein
MSISQPPFLSICTINKPKKPYSVRHHLHWGWVSRVPNTIKTPIKCWTARKETILTTSLWLWRKLTRRSCWRSKRMSCIIKWCKKRKMGISTRVSRNRSKGWRIIYSLKYKQRKNNKIMWKMKTWCTPRQWRCKLWSQN